MTDTGEQLVDALHMNLECPQCAYNLRGLLGDVVTCPECGLTCDLAKLIANRWTAQWHKAPKLSTLALPTACMVGAFLVWMTVAIIVSLGGSGRPPIEWIGLIVLLMALVPYGLAIRRAFGVFDDLRGVWLALLNHAIFIGYIGSFLTVLFTTIKATASGAIVTALGLVSVAIVLALVVGIYLACRRGEQFIARACIRRYLAVKARGEATERESSNF